MWMAQSFQDPYLAHESCAEGDIELDLNRHDLVALHVTRLQYFPAASATDSGFDAISPRDDPLHDRPQLISRTSVEAGHEGQYRTSRSCVVEHRAARKCSLEVQTEMTRLRRSWADMFFPEVAVSTRKTQDRVILGRAHVLRELHAGGPRSPVEIVASLGHADLSYSQGVVEARVHELREQGLVRLGSAESVGVRTTSPERVTGRPRQFATLTDAWGLGLGLEIGSSTMRAAVVTPGGEQIAGANRSRPSHRLEPTMVDASACVAEVLESLTTEQSEQLVGSVVAVPSPVNVHTHTGGSPAFPAFRRGSLDELFAHALPIGELPVTTVNDADARAIAEGRFGLARASHSAFVLKVSGGVGGALLRRGRIQGGFRGMAGEVGHLRVSLDSLSPPPREWKPRLPRLDPDARCPCGDVDGQHVEAYASTPAIVRRLEDCRKEQVVFEQIAASWRSEQDARRCVEDAAHVLGQVAAIVVTVCDPAKIVITGRFAACGADALEPIKQALTPVRPLEQDPPQVVVDGPREDPSHDDWEWVGVQGAGRLAIELNSSPEDPPEP
jgi:predicted NBD/HSP70 family sugar kinase